MKREGDFFDNFMQFSKNLSSPSLFRKWAAISLIAGAAERKVWVKTLGSKLYPNMYVILVAPPGVGKTELTWRIRELWGSLESHHLASSSVTKASLIDELAKAERRFVTHDPVTPVEAFNSLLIAINELGVFLPAYENEFMNTLTDLWDCKGYSESRRTSSIQYDIKKVQLNMICATTPSYLNNVLPEGAWDQGFIARTILVYSGDREKKSLFADMSSDEGEFNFLKEQLETIANKFGEIKFTEDAARLIDHFHMTDGEPAPDHPKLMSYKVRRTVHMLKLCQVSCLSRMEDFTITVEDFHRAYDWLVEAELQMPEIFKAMSSGGAGRVMEDTWYWLFTTYAKEQKPIGVHRLIQFLQERVPVHNVQTTIDLMEGGKLIKKQLTSAGAAYIPLGKEEYGAIEHK